MEAVVTLAHREALPSWAEFEKAMMIVNAALEGLQTDIQQAIAREMGVTHEKLLANGSGRVSFKSV